MITYQQRARRIRLIIFDVDGVLTDGKLMISGNGEVYKAFHAQDGLGITMLRLMGINSAIITGRQSEIVAFRAAELKITDVYQGEKNKLRALKHLASKQQCSFDEIAYVGDDLVDIPAFKNVGLACAVANAVPEVKSLAHYITTHKGGDGAVREVAEMILNAQGKWEQLLSAYFTEKPLEDQAQ